MELSSRYKLRGGSLIESVIAMTIIAICLSIAVLMYGRLLGTDNNMTFYKAQQQVKELLWETKVAKSIENETYDFESYTIEKTVEELKNEKSYKIVFAVKANGRKQTYQYIVNY